MPKFKFLNPCIILTVVNLDNEKVFVSKKPSILFTKRKKEALKFEIKKGENYFELIKRIEEKLPFKVTPKLIWK